MKEEAVPVPPRRSSAYSDNNVLYVQELSHFLGIRCGGGEPPVMRSGFLLNVLQTRYF